MKAHTLIILLFLLSRSSYGQVTRFDGPIEEEASGESIQSLIGTDQNSLYVLKQGYEKLSVYSYNKKTLVKEWSKSININNNIYSIKRWLSGTNPNLTFVKDGKICLILPAAKIKEDKAVALYITINTETRAISEPMELASIDEEWVNNKMYRDYISYFFVISPDSSKMIFRINAPRLATLYYPTFKAVIIDLKTLKPFTRKLPANFQGYPILHEAYAINNEGKVAIIVKFPSDAIGNFISDTSPEQEEKAGLNRDKYWGELYSSALAFFDMTTGITKLSFPNYGTDKRVYIETRNMAFVKSDKLLLTGILTDDEKQKDKKKNSFLYAGHFNVSTGKADFETMQYFSEQWRVKYDPAKYADAGATGHSGYNFTYNLDEKSSYYITAYKRGGWNKNPAKYGGFVLDDAIIAKLNPEQGKFEWIKTMPISVTIDGGTDKTWTKYYSISFYSDGKMYYYFNDHKDNLSKIDVNSVETSPETKIAKAYYDADINTVNITIDSKGKMEKTVIGNNSASGLYPLDKLIWMDKNKILLFYKTWGKENFSILSIK